MVSHTLADQKQRAGWGQKPRWLSPSNITPVTHLDFSQSQNSHNSSRRYCMRTKGLTTPVCGVYFMFNLHYGSFNDFLFSCFVCLCEFMCMRLHLFTEKPENDVASPGAGVLAICAIPGLLQGSLLNEDQSPHDYAESCFNQ